MAAPASRPLAYLSALCLALALGCAGLGTRDPGEIAGRYAEAGRYEEATREIEVAVRRDPEDVRLRQQAAGIHARAGDVGKAIDHLEVAIRLSPRNPESWIALGELENGRQNVADAYVAYRRAAELAPGDIRAISGLALAADSLGFDDEAELAYARWAELEREQGGAPTTQRE
jgi:Flp pilus assembly protein TadD